MEYGWPQIMVVVWFGMCIGASLMKDGQPIDGKHSFVVRLIFTAITAWILKEGGFF